MENIILWISSVLFYFWLVWLLYLLPNKKIPSKRYAKILALLAILTMPVNIGGNVFTIAGNAVSERSVYSIFSVFQKAEENTISLAGVNWQEAGWDAVTVVGVSGYQRAGRDAATGIGISGYQKADRDAGTGIGISGYQRANNSAVTKLGVAFYQKVGKVARAFAVWSTLKD